MSEAPVADRGTASPRSVLLVAGVALATALLAAVLFLLHHSYCIYDDTYIYFRFVENTVRGCFLEYNCGDGPVEGFTSPLYFVLLTLGRMLTDDLESVSQVLGIVTVCGTMLAAALLVIDPRFSVTGSAWEPALRVVGVALLLGLDHYYLLNTVVGMETGLGGLVGLLVARSALHPERRGLRFWAVAALFVRPEYGLLVLLLPFFPEARRVRYWWPVALVGVVTVGVRFALFGDVLPNTFWAKSGGTLQHARLGAIYLGQAVVTFPVLAVAPAALLLRGNRRPVQYLVAVIGLWLVYFLRSGGDFYSYSRMAVPLVPLASVLAVAGLPHLLRRVPALRSRAVVAAVVVVGCWGLAAAWLHHIPEQHGFPKVQRWASLAKYLGTVHAGESVAATAVGALGYFNLEAPIYDIVGIVDRTVAKEGERAPDINTKSKIGHARYHTAHTLSRKPAFIVILVAWLDHPWGPGEKVETTIYGEWKLLEAAQRGAAPYRPYTPQVAPDLYWFLLRRLPEAASQERLRSPVSTAPTRAAAAPQKRAMEKAR